MRELSSSEVNDRIKEELGGGAEVIGNLLSITVSYEKRGYNYSPLWFETSWEVDRYRDSLKDNAEGILSKVQSIMESIGYEYDMPSYYYSGGHTVTISYDVEYQYRDSDGRSINSGSMHPSFYKTFYLSCKKSSASTSSSSSSSSSSNKPSDKGYHFKYKKSNNITRYGEFHINGKLKDGVYHDNDQQIFYIGNFDFSERLVDGFYMDHGIIKKWLSDRKERNIERDVKHAVEWLFGLFIFKWYLRDCNENPDEIEKNVLSNNLKYYQNHSTSSNSYSSSSSTSSDKMLEKVKSLANQYSGDYLFKKGQELNRVKDYQNALEHFLAATLKDKMFAAFYVGYYYEKGIVLNQSLDKALEWYKKSAARGEPASMNNIGTILKNRGEYKAALEWYKKAADKGFEMGRNNYNNLYKKIYG